MGAIISRVVRVAGRTVVRLGVALSLLVLVAIGIGPLTGRYRVVTVLSASMSPRLSVGSLAISTPEPLDQVHVGQIITFQAPIGDHWVITHRVIEVVSDGVHPRVRTKGDANTAPDPWIARLNRGPIWQVRTVVPALGTGVRVLRSRWIHVASVLIAPALLVIVSLQAIWRPSVPRRRRRFRRPTTAST